MPTTAPDKYTGPVLRVGFLWHQHQPYYKDLLTGDYLLPWVRLHGAKDYLDMVEILDNYPAIKQTFNMVPSLLEQLDDYARGQAIDPHLTLSVRRAEDLTADDKAAMLNLLFQANYDTMIGNNLRYAYLHRTRTQAMENWTPQEWRDLQSLANLAWIDPMYKSSGPMKALAAKGERYTEDDKQAILTEQRRIVGRIVPSLKEYMKRGQIEVSVTPYFHPIMPLLYDTSSALVAMPGAPMPQNRFQHPEDVRRQVEDAVELYANRFGQKPQGMWPSEGSVSEDIISILCENGIRWIATDEEILAESLGISARGGDSGNLVSSGQLYRGCQFEKKGAGITIFFRDHAMSDNIGFVYSKWDPQRAADDFVGKLQAIHQNLLARKVENPIVSIILDGENAWEYYRNDGHDFLDALYTKISKSPWLKTVTFGQYLDEKPSLAPLKKLFPGSWISHNFSVWIGHNEDNKAWDLLYKAREELDTFQKANPRFDPAKLKLAWKEIYIAEGSDWCWWFGPDHIGPNNDDFDRLFRSHLANVYYLTDRKPPAELFQPIRSSFMMAHLFEPIDYVTPVIDGRLTHYYEWQEAGFFDCTKAGSTMHKSEHLVSGIWFGFDKENLYFRIDRGITVVPERFKKLTFELEFLNSERNLVTIQPEAERGSINGKLNELIRFKLAELFEIAIPMDILSHDDETMLLTRLMIKDDQKLLETWPPTDAIKIELPKASAHDFPWTV